MFRIRSILCVIFFNQLFGFILCQVDSNNQLNGSQLDVSKMTGGREGLGYERSESRGWMDTAKSALAQPAGQLAVHFAKEMIRRSTGNSQILSLNLTNLLVLLLLKALIFTAGLIGAGNWSQYARGRSVDSTASLISADEPSLFIGYLAAEGSGDDGCLHRAACKTPKRTTEYLRAAKAILKGAEMFDATIAYNSHYHDVVQKAERAVLDGMTGAPCEAIYPCRL